MVLDYSFDVTNETEVFFEGVWRPFSGDVVFVAVENGEHEGRGFAHFASGLIPDAPNEKTYASDLYVAI